MEIVKRKRVILPVGAGVLVLGGVVALWPRETEPVYHGKPLSYWAERYLAQQLGKESPDARPARAVQEIGTNSFPYLLSWIAYEPSPIRRQLVSAANKVSRNSPALVFSWMRGDQYNRRAASALFVFDFLGTNAGPAVPKLKSIAAEAKHPTAARRAKQCLFLMSMHNFVLERPEESSR
jgi:hypothetical protein